MKIDQAVLDAHAQFGGDLETMQKTYEHADLVTEITRLRQALSLAEQRVATAESEKTGLLQSLQHHTGCDHGVMAIRMLVDRAEAAEKRENDARAKALEESAQVAERDVDWSAFGKRDIQPWKNGNDSVRDYRLGIATGRAIAASIRALQSEER